MAVLIRERMLVGGVEVDLKTYRPGGRLGKRDRERADELDRVLATTIPLLADGVAKSVLRNDGPVHRWYVLGQKLRELVDDQDAVSATDVSSGLIWQAVWYYLPDGLKPAGSNEDKSYSDKQHKRKDHLSLCYEISHFEWDEVQWIQRWDDWHQLAFRPGLLRDRRILEALGAAISQLTKYPTRDQFRTIVKSLGDKFPTKHLRDSSLLDLEQIVKTVNEAVGSFN